MNFDATTSDPRVEPVSTSASVIQVDEVGEAWASDVAPKDLMQKTARRALVSIGAQGGMFVLRTGSLMVLARLLLKEDFGLVNMVDCVHRIPWVAAGCRSGDGCGSACFHYESADLHSLLDQSRRGWVACLAGCGYRSDSRRVLW